MLDRISRQAELMDRVIERVGVIPGVAARVDRGLAFYEARTKCISCVHEWECRQWLARRPAERSAPAEFCPNAEFLRCCAMQQSPAARAA
jgi:hypothetical protein